MNASTRDVLAELLAEHLYDRGHDVRAWPADEQALHRAVGWRSFSERNEYVRRLRFEKAADAICARLTVLDGPPIGIRYAYLWTHNGKPGSARADGEAQAIRCALDMRAQQLRIGQPVDAVPASAPIAPWVPFPLPEDGGQ